MQYFVKNLQKNLITINGFKIKSWLLQSISKWEFKIYNYNCEIICIILQ